MLTMMQMEEVSRKQQMRSKVVDMQAWHTPSAGPFRFRTNIVAPHMAEHVLTDV